MNFRACIRVNIQFSSAESPASKHDTVVIAVTSEDCPAAGLQGLLEGHPELAVEVGVYEWIEGRVEVTYPEDCGNYHWGAVARRTAQCGYQVPEIKKNIYR